MAGGSAQLVLPGIDPPDALAAARADLARVRAAWEAVAHLRDSPERIALQPRYFAALVRVEKLTLGDCWWH